MRSPSSVVLGSGKLVFLAGVTAAPAYHSHPHQEEEFAFLPSSMKEQSVLALERLTKTLEAAGCGLRDVVSATRFVTNADETAELDQVWFDYFNSAGPVTSTVQVGRLAAHPRLKLEVSAVAVRRTSR